jgi:uncharacterized protein (DUF983 family)
MPEIDECPFCGSKDVFWHQEISWYACKACGQDLDIEDSDIEGDTADSE